MSLAAGLLARVDLNLFESFGLIARYAEAGELRERDGLLIAATGLPSAMFNIAFVTRPLADPAASLIEAVAYFDARALPFVVRVRDGLHPAAEQAAKAMGLPFSDAVPGMVLEDPGARGSWVEGLVVRTAAPGSREWTDAVEVLAIGFEAPVEVASVIVPPAMLSVPDLELYTGYYRARPVATSTLVATHRVAGVYNVATVPEARRRGIGEAMTWHAVRRGHEMGCIVASLQASDMGKPVYQRMGFRHVVDYRTFHRPGV